MGENNVRIRQLFLALLMLAAPMVASAQDDDDDVIALPEPATLALLGAGVAAVIVARTAKRK